jgi:hypothetical protein
MNDDELAKDAEILKATAEALEAFTAWRSRTDAADEELIAGLMLLSELSMHDEVGLHSKSDADARELRAFLSPGGLIWRAIELYVQLTRRRVERSVGRSLTPAELERVVSNAALGSFQPPRP